MKKFYTLGPGVVFPKDRFSHDKAHVENCKMGLYTTKPVFRVSRQKETQTSPLSDSLD